MDTLDKRAKKIYVRTVDTDVIVVLVGIFSELQNKTTDIDCGVNELRQELFSKRTKLMENIPPTRVVCYTVTTCLWLIFSFL